MIHFFLTVLTCKQFIFIKAKCIYAIKGMEGNGGNSGKELRHLVLILRNKSMKGDEIDGWY